MDSAFKYLFVAAVLVTGCTGSLPQSNTLPDLDGRHVSNVDATSVGGVTAAMVKSTVDMMGTATSASDASSVVRRDASGNFSAGTITGILNGNASSASIAGWAIGKQGPAIASTATLPLTGDGNFFLVTGNTSISGMSPRQLGARVTLRFQDTVTVLHNSATFALSGYGPLKVASGDFLEFISVGDGQWREIMRNIRNDSEAYADGTGAGAVGLNGVEVPVVYPNAIFDSQDEYNSSTGVFTAKQSGTYLIHASYYTTTLAWGASGFCRIIVKFNASNLAALSKTMGGQAESCYIAVDTFARLSPGDSLFVTAYSNGAVSLPASPAQAAYQFRIKRLGGNQ